MATFESANTDTSTSDSQVVTAPLKSQAANSGLPIMSIPVVEIDGTLYPIILTNMVSGVLPISKGGTGLTSLDGGRLLASNEDGTLLEEIDVNVQSFAGLRGNIEDRLSKTRRYVVDIPTSGWTKNPSGDGYYQSFAVDGMTGSDNPVVGLVSSATTDEALRLERVSYGYMDSIITDKNKITVYCFTEVPTNPFSISVNCTGA
jgi:hypothetical protein